MRILLIILLLCLSVGSAMAQTYRWVDENGQTVFSDQPPGDSRAYSTFNETLEPLGVSGTVSGEQQQRHEQRVEELLAEQQKKHKVDLYVTDWCPYCEKALAFFRARNIPVSVYDVEKDRSAWQRKNQLAPNTGVPFAVVNGQKILGYNPGMYEQALGL